MYNTSFSQDSIRNKLVGTWELCISFDTLDINCVKPYTHFQLKSDGQFEGDTFFCGNQKAPFLSTWKFEKGSIYIAASEDRCYKRPAHGYYHIIFITNDMFYNRTVSTVESGGHPMFTIYRRRK